MWHLGREPQPKKYQTTKGRFEAEPLILGKLYIRYRTDNKSTGVLKSISKPKNKMLTYSSTPIPKCYGYICFFCRLFLYFYHVIRQVSLLI